MRTSRLALYIALPAMIAAAVLGAAATAQSPPSGELTLTGLERGSTFTHVRNTRPTSPRSNLQGDLIVLTNPLADADGRIVGRLHVDCVTTVGARDFRKSVLTCTGLMVLRDGTIALQAIVSPAVRTTTGAVTGGTGVYANAHGVFADRPSGRDTTTTITFAP